MTPGASVASPRARRIPSACCTSSMPCWRKRAGRCLRSTALLSAQARGRSPASGSPAASRRDWDWVPACRWCRCPRSRRWRRRNGATMRATHVVACLDARMREVYVAAYARESGAWNAVLAPAVLPPADVAMPSRARGSWHGVGGGFAAYPALAVQLATGRCACRRGAGRARDRRVGATAARRRRGRRGCRRAARLRPPPRRADDGGTRRRRNALSAPAVHGLATEIRAACRGGLAAARVEGRRVCRGARGAHPRGALDARQFSRSDRGRLQHARRRARRPHRRLWRADAGAGRGAAPQSVRRARRPPLRAGTAAARAIPGRCAQARRAAGVPRGSRVQRRGDRPLRERRVRAGRAPRVLLSCRSATAPRARTRW